MSIKSNSMLVASHFDMFVASTLRHAKDLQIVTWHKWEVPSMTYSEVPNISLFSSFLAIQLMELDFYTFISLALLAVDISVWLALLQNRLLLPLILLKFS